MRTRGYTFLLPPVSRGGLLSGGVCAVNASVCREGFALEYVMHLSFESEDAERFTYLLVPYDDDNTKDSVSPYYGIRQRVPPPCACDADKSSMRQTGSIEVERRSSPHWFGAYCSDIIALHARCYGEAAKRRGVDCSCFVARARSKNKRNELLLLEGRKGRC